jgi:ankyrin repeat protein
MAARAGYTDIVKMIIYFGGSTEDKGLRGSTPLVSAAGADHLETVVALLDAGADIQGNNLEENTALHVATTLESPVSMIRTLLKRGADIATVNRIGHTPVRMAVSNANALAVDALGGRAAMVDMKDEDLFVGDSVGADDDDDDDDMAEPSLTDFGRSASLLEEGSQISALTVPGLATTQHQGSNMRAPRQIG